MKSYKRRLKQKLAHDLSRFVDKYDVEGKEDQKMFVGHLLDLFTEELERLTPPQEEDKEAVK